MALSRGSPRVGVTHHRALWSPDFPRRLRAAITRPTRPRHRVRRCPVRAITAATFLTMTSRGPRTLVSLFLAATLALTGTFVGAGGALADEDLKRKKKACTAEPRNYACLKASDRREVAGEPVTFTGSLSKRAQRNLASWTGGENTICLTRYAPKPEKDGSWPWETLDKVCSTLNTDGTFGMVANLGVQGLHYYGVEMGPCRASRDECGNSDPGLLGLSNRGDRVVAVRTVAQ